jgi:hypothetical protein
MEWLKRNFITFTNTPVFSVYHVVYDFETARIIDYRCEDMISFFRELRGDIDAILLVFTPSFLITLITKKKKRGTVQPRDAFKDAAFKPGLETVKTYTEATTTLSYSHFCEIDVINGFLTSSSLTRAFSISYARIKPCFIAEERVGAYECPATRGHRKTRYLQIYSRWEE